MNKKQFALVALSIVALALAFLVSFSAANSPASQKWEYLVVTPGKVTWCGENVLFENCPLGAAKTDVSKATGFKAEAVKLEKLLDKVGQQGWELVSIIGMIGGDQEFVFKRAIR